MIRREIFGIPGATRLYALHQGRSVDGAVKAMDAYLSIRRAVVPGFGGFHGRELGDDCALAWPAFDVFKWAVGGEYFHVMANECFLNGYL